MNERRMIVWALPFALSAAVACSHENETNAVASPPGTSTVESYSSATPQAAQPPTPVAEAPVPNEPAPRVASWPRDPGKAVIDAAMELSDADAISLTDAQRATLYTQREKLEASRKAIGTAFRTLRADLANEVRVGVIDTAKMQADEAAVVNALRFHDLQEADTLNALHAALDPTQRSDVVAAVRAERPGGMAEPQAPGGQTASRGDKQEEHLDRLTRDLSLDPSQRQQVAAILQAQPAPSGMRGAKAQRTDALLNAFESDTFDAATAIESAPSPTSTVYDRIQRRINFVSQLLPILRPDQRDRLASRIESNPMAPGHEGMSPGHEDGE